MFKKSLAFVTLLAALTCFTPHLRAGGGMGGGFPGGFDPTQMGGMGGGFPGGFDPTQMGGMGSAFAGGPGTLANVTTLQNALASPDDEWAVLAPKVQRVLDALQQLPSSNILQNGGNMRNFGNSGGGFAGMAGLGGATTTSPGQTALTALLSILQDPYQPEDQIHAKLITYRNAVKTAQTALKSAQEDLRNYVTLRQEGILITLGYLD
jgi:hypothetical protein